MDVPPAWSQACICGRTFSVPQAYTCHTRSCPKTKKRLSSALEKAKEVFQAKKRRKIEDVARREALETSGHLAAELPSHEVNLPTHQQVGFLCLVVSNYLLIQVLVLIRLPRRPPWSMKILINL